MSNGNLAFHLETTVGDLKAVLRQLLPVVVSRGKVPVQSCVLIDGDGVTGADFGVRLTLALPASAQRGAACVNLRTVLAALNGWSPDANVSLSSIPDEPGLVLRIESFVAKLSAIDPSDFPSIEVPVLPRQHIDGCRLATALGGVLPYVSTQATRYYLKGVFFDPVDGALVATNGHVLRKVDVELPSGCRGGILGAAAARVLSAFPIIEKAGMADGWAVFSGGGVRLVARLVDGSYPDYRRVIPAPSVGDMRYRIDSNEARRKLRRLTSVARSASLPERVYLSHKGGLFSLSLGQLDCVAASEQLSGEVYPEDKEAPVLGLNNHYFDLLLASAAGPVELRFGRESPVSAGDTVMSPVRADLGDGVVVIMPLRIDLGESPQAGLARAARLAPASQHSKSLSAASAVT